MENLQDLEKATQTRHSILVWGVFSNRTVGFI